MTKHKINKQAFTLVELIVVITILAILWTIAFISLQWYSKDARDSVRISDVSNMKTALELFHLDSWKYPLPDDGETVVYSWAIVWTQWDFWTTVLSQLSRSLSEIPTDPVNDKKYIYSVSWNKNQFEILNPLEWDLALNTISQTNAASEARIPKISGEYNGLYVKTGNYIVATPSLITAYWYISWADLSTTILSSMVVEWYWNIPSIWNSLSNTWAISWIVLSATWIINKDSTDAEKISVMKTIQSAYTGSNLAWRDVYSFILSKTSDADILALSNSIILKEVVKPTAAVTVNWACTWLVANAVYFNDTTSYSLIEAVGWTDLTAWHNATPTENTCEFKCDNSYSWSWSSCDLVVSYTWPDTGILFRDTWNSIPNWTNVYLSIWNYATKVLKTSDIVILWWQTTPISTSYEVTNDAGVTWTQYDWTGGSTYIDTNGLNWSMYLNWGASCWTVDGHQITSVWILCNRSTGSAISTHWLLSTASPF